MTFYVNKRELKIFALGISQSIALLISIGSESVQASGCEALDYRENYTREANFAPIRVDTISGAMFRDQDFPNTYAIEGWKQRYLTEITQVLKAQGVDLILLMHPPKGLLYDQELLNRLNPEISDFNLDLAISSFDNTISTLQLQGINIPNIRTFLAESERLVPYYIPDNTHWSPEGAINAGLAVRDVIERIDPDALPQLDTNFVVSGWTEKSMNGNLSRAVADVCGHVFSPTKVLFPFVESTSEAGDISQSLFSNVVVDNTPLLIGTSFSNGSSVDKFGAEPVFRYTFQGDILNHSVHAGGFRSAIEAYFTQTDVQMPRFAVWEFMHDQLTRAGIGAFAQILGSVQPDCNGGTFARYATHTIEDGEWVRAMEGISLQDYIKVEISGFDQGNVSVRSNYDTEEQVILGGTKSTRIPLDWRTDLWSFHISDVSQPYPMGNPTSLDIRIRGAESYPLTLSIIACASGL